MQRRVVGMLLLGVAILSLVSCADSDDTDPDLASELVERVSGSEPPILQSASADSSSPGRSGAESVQLESHSTGEDTPEPLRGVYLTGWAARARLDETIDYMRRHQLNALVIDVKDTDGRLSFALPGTLADDLGANAAKMGSPQEVQRALDRLREHGIYVIGRVALFQDNFLPYKRPDWALQTATGELWRDAAGNTWLDPTHPAVLEYHVEIAVAAAKMGFDEIQFDYLRYPSQRVRDYNDATRKERVQAITGFATAARECIQERANVPVSGAIYGIVAVSESDHHLGQDLLQLSEALDYVSPMFYPSHYRAGDFGLARPAAEPYKTVFASTAAALGRTTSAQWKQLRPWIQSFFGYDSPEVEAQIRALKDLGIDSFLVWNPSGRYLEGVDYLLAGEGDGYLAESPFRSVLYTLLSPAEGVFAPDAALKLPSHLDFLACHDQHALRLEATRQRHGYRIEVLESLEHEPSVGGEERLLVISLQDPSALGPDSTTAAKSGTYLHTSDARHEGAALTWLDDGYAWYVWAPSMTAARAAKSSLQALPTELF